MPGCSVKYCTNHPRKSGEGGLSYFRVPAAETGKTWILRCGIQGDGSNSRVCSQHFTDDEFHDPEKKILKVGSLPSLNLPKTPTHQIILSRPGIVDGEEMQFRADNLVINLRTNKCTLQNRSTQIVDLREDPPEDGNEMVVTNANELSEMAMKLDAETALRQKLTIAKKQLVLMKRRLSVANM